MKVTADTNVLVRALVGDDLRQSRLAQDILVSADVVAVATSSLCELVWVLSQGYKIGAAEIAAALRRLIDSANVAVNRPAVEAGLSLLESGGDFADGVIAHEGDRLGGDAFVSFDKDAVRLLKKQGVTARLVA